MYGHQFYRFPVERRVQFINTELNNGHYQSVGGIGGRYFSGCPRHET